MDVHPELQPPATHYIIPIIPEVTTTSSIIITISISMNIISINAITITAIMIIVIRMFVSALSW